MSENTPQGEVVDPHATPPAAQPKGPVEITPSGWIMSSFDLMSGTDISEDPETLPDELFDQFFGPDAEPRTNDGD